MPNLGILSPYLKPHTRNLGVTFDSDFCFHKQIAAVVKELLLKELPAPSVVKHC